VRGFRELDSFEDAFHREIIRELGCKPCGEVAAIRALRARVAVLESTLHEIAASIHVDDWGPDVDASKLCTAVKSFAGHTADIEARLASSGLERFMTEDGDGEHDLFDSLAEARDCAGQYIDNWRKEANSDGEWSSCVEGVTVWVAIERAVGLPMAKQWPDDPDSTDFVLRPLPDQREEGKCTSTT